MGDRPHSCLCSLTCQLWGLLFGYPGTPSWVGRDASRHAPRRIKRASPKQYTPYVYFLLSQSVCVSLVVHLP